MKNEKTKKKRGGFLYFLISALLILLLVVLLLPIILSTSLVKNSILAKVNKGGGQELSIDKWKFSWTSHMNLEGISFKNEELSADIDSLKIEKGLIHIAKNKDLGQVIISQLNVVAALLPKETPSSPPDLNEPGAKPDSVKQRKSSPAKESAAKKGAVDIFKQEFPDLKAVIVIEGGSVELVESTGVRIDFLHDLDVRVDLNPGGKVLTKKIIAKLSGTSGNVVLIGDAAAPQSGSRQLGDLFWKSQLNFNNIEFDKILPLLPPALAAEELTGKGTFVLQVDGSKNDKMNVVSQLIIKGASLNAAALKGDQPRLEDLQLFAKGYHQAGNIQIEKFNLNSDYAAANFSGSIEELTKINGAGEASINLAEISRNFANSMGMQEGLTLRKGNLNITLKGAKEGTLSSLEGKLSLPELSGALEGREVNLSEPIHADFKLLIDEDTPKLENFNINSSFLSGNGSGDLQNLNVDLNANLAALLTELSQFKELNGLGLSGAINGNINISAADAEQKLTAQLDLNAVGVSQDGKALFASETGRIGLNALINQDGDSISLPKASFNFQLPMAKGRLLLEELNLGDEITTPSIQHSQFSGTVDVAQILALAKLSGAAPDELVLEGQGNINGSFSLKQNSINIPSLSAKLENFVFAQGSKKITDAEITLEAKATIQTELQKFNLSGLTLKGSEGLMLTGELSSENWDAIANNLNANLAVHGQLGQLESLIFPPEKQGAASGALTLNLEHQENKAWDIKGTARQLNLSINKKPVIENQDMEIALVAKADKEFNHVDIRRLSFKSTPLNLVAAGSLSDVESTKRLQLEGKLAYDLSEITRWMQLLQDQEITMTGKSDKAFNLDTPLGEKEPIDMLRNTIASLELQAESISAYGLELKNLSIPVTVRDQYAGLSVSGAIQQGAVKLVPSLSIKEEPPVLTLSTNELVLTEVELTTEFSNKVLSRIHPLFSGASVTDGKISLGFDDFYMPVDKAGWEKDTHFSGTIYLRGVRLKASGLIQEILTVAKVRENEFNLEDTEIKFTCIDGKIRSEPITLKIDDYQLIFDGYVGLNKQVQYAVSVPLTEELVGSDAFKYVEGQRVSLPITGTVDNPKIDSSGIVTAVADAAKGAAKKAIGDEIEGLINKEAGKLLEGLFGK